LPTTVHVRVPGRTPAADVVETESESPAGSPVATAESDEPSESASDAETTSGGEIAEPYTTLAFAAVTAGCAWIVKFAFETSKKTFPTASILIRAVVVPA